MLQKGCAVKAGEAKEWSLTTEGCQGAANFAASFADACLAASTHEANKAQSIPQLGSAKMSIRSILSHLQVRNQCFYFFYQRSSPKSFIVKRWKLYFDESYADILFWKRLDNIWDSDQSGFIGSTFFLMVKNLNLKGYPYFWFFRNVFKIAQQTKN